MRYEREHDRSNGHVYDDIAPPFIVIPTVDGEYRADDGDWVIQETTGDFSTCKPEIFKARYDAVCETSK